MTRNLTTRARRGALAVALALVAPVAVVAATAAPSAAALPSCTTTWTSAVDGSWDDASKWTGGTVPTTTDHVCITTPGSYTVTLTAPEGGVPSEGVAVASLRVGDPGPGTATQRLVVQHGVQRDIASLLAIEGMEIAPRGVVELGEVADLTVSFGVVPPATLVNAGRIAEVAGSDDDHIIWGDVVNTGTLQLDHTLRIAGDLTTDGTLQVNHVLHVEGTMWTRGGTVRGDWIVVAYDGLTVGEADTDTSAGSPTFLIEGGDLSFVADSPIDVTSRGPITVTGDTGPGQDIKVQSIEGIDSTLTFDGTWTNRGHLALEPGVAHAIVAGSEDDSVLVNEGSLERFSEDGADARVDTDVINRGRFATNGGVVVVDGDLRNEGVLEAGLGQVLVLGALALRPTGTVALDTRTPVATTEYGSLSVNGPIAVDGTLHATSDGAPAPGTALVVLLSGSTRAGTFDEVRFSGDASYDAQYTATEVRLVRRASESATRRFVRAAFQDFLGRQPDSKELSQHATSIDAGGETRAFLVRSLARSPAYVTTLVQRFYADTLGRPGDPGGVAFWVDELRSGRKTVAEVAGSFYASPEYFNRAGGTNQAWITDLYDVFFERPPSTDDLTYWTTRIAQRGRTRVAVELFQSLESRRQRVDRLYQDLLGRDGDADGVDYWAGRLTREGDLALAVFLAASGEYLARAQIRYP